MQLVQLLAQLGQLGILLAAVLGTAFMASLFALLLAFGLLLDSQTPQFQALSLIYGLLLSQSLLLFTLKKAILASDYTAFCATMGLPKWFAKISDIGLSLLCQPLLWLNLLVLANISLSHFWQALNLWQLLLLQLLSALLALYRSVGLLAFFAIGLVSFGLISGVSLGYLLTGWVVIALLCFACPEVVRNRTIILHGARSLWLQYCLHNADKLLVRMGFSLVILLLSQVLLHQRGDLALVNIVISAQLLVLINTSIQLDCQGFVQRYQRFFNSYFYQSTQARWRFAPSALATVVWLTGLSLLHQQVVLVLVQLAAAMACIYYTDRYPKYFSFIWLLNAGLATATTWLISNQMA